MSIISGAVLPVLPAVVDAFDRAKQASIKRCNKMTVMRVETSDSKTKIVGILLPSHIKAWRRQGISACPHCLFPRYFR